MAETERFALLEQAARETCDLVEALPTCVGCPRPATRMDGTPPKVRGLYCDVHAPGVNHDLPYAQPLRKVLTRLLRLGIRRAPRAE